MFWIDKKAILHANFIWNMRELLEIFESDEYSEFFFNVNGNKVLGRDNLL